MLMITIFATMFIMVFIKRKVLKGFVKSEYFADKKRAFINYNENDDVIPLDVEDGFDCSYVTKVIYEGITGTEDSPYKIIIPKVEGINKESIQDKLLDIAMKCVVDRVVEEENKSKQLV